MTQPKMSRLTCRMITCLILVTCIFHNVTAQETATFHTPQAKNIYTAIKEKGADYFLRNSDKVFADAGYLKQDDMVLLDAGEHLLEEKKADEAIALYKVYTKEFPDIVVAWNDLGDAYLLKNEKVKAKESFQQALKLRPGNERAKKNLEKLGN